METKDLVDLGDYEFFTKDFIGGGSFSVVFKGRLKKDHSKTVAVKRVEKRHLTHSKNLLAKEIKILKDLSSLRHENIVLLKDCKESAKYVYIITELCNCGDLSDYIREKGKLSENTIRLFLLHLVEALKMLHGKGVVHRDLKPQNILLNDPGNRPCPQPQHYTLKIADFGFARFLPDDKMAETLCGSPMYMAPEVLMESPYNIKADLWSLGCIIYQCLTGKAPFHATTPENLKNFYAKNVNLIPTIPSATSPELTSLIMGLLKRNPMERIDFESFFNHPFLQQAGLPSDPPCAPEADQGLKHSSLISKSWVIWSKDFITSASPEDSDDFEIVPSNLPTDKRCNSQHRPCSLPIAVPKQCSGDIPDRQSAKESVVARGTSRSPPDVSTMTPPSVQFVLGTPPGPRRILAETPPPISTWRVTPANSPLRKTVLSSPLLTNTNNFVPPLPFSAKAFTFPEMGSAFETMTPYVVPELPLETLLEKEHNETLAKLNFVLAVSECVVEVSESRPRDEKLVLIVRVLQLLSSGLNLATTQLREKTLQPSPNVKKVLKNMQALFKKQLTECKLIKNYEPGITQHVTANADKILYTQAMSLCQKAAIDELMGNTSECFQRYQVAHILLHSLSQTVSYQEDRALLTKYKESVERRLTVLQEQGVVYANSTEL